MQSSSLFAGRAAFHFEFTDSPMTSREPLEHFHDAFELALFLKADISIFIKDRKYDIRDGDLLFIDSYEIHRMVYKPDQHYKRYVLNFQHRFVQDLLRTLGQESLFQAIRSNPNAKIRLNLKQRLSMEEHFSRLMTLNASLAENRDDGTMQAELTMRLILLLQEVYRIGQAQRQARSDSRLHLLVVDMLLYIDSRYSEDIQLEQLAAAVGKSKYYICRLFKESTTFTIVEYIQYRRVIEAQKKLLESDMHIIDIGLACGFQSLQHFYRVFKRISRLTPAQYRAGRHD
ncbi:helix-turn-helix domain-containing protein [Cohnella boryungensis]|uniref:Helix-turn-helix domain-containing protein n=1 Tax=Cohnella boryungensis TaxID=768479 RepID=A0ABV8S5S9_9BACL